MAACRLITTLHCVVPVAAARTTNSRGAPMRHYSRSILGAAIAAVLASPGIVWAQSADAGLRGKAPANADVTVKNVATGATRRTHSSADGTYVLSGLPPGTYRVDAGPGNETTVTLSVASKATLDLTAGSGA